MPSKKITKLEIQKKNKNRCSVFLDDEYAFGIDQELIYQYDLKKGRLLSDTDIEQILYQEEKKKAKNRALNFLAYRDRSEKEISDKLRTIGYDAQVSEWVIDELKRLRCFNRKLSRFHKAPLFMNYVLSFFFLAAGKRMLFKINR